MELYGFYAGKIKGMHNTPYKIAVYTDGKNVKVFEKVMYRIYNPYNMTNWFRNTLLEGGDSLKNILCTLEKLNCIRV